MSFSDNVRSITDPPTPKGTPQYISPEKFNKLESKARRYYRPEWKKYVTKHRREYEDCDLGYTHFMGWVKYQVPIGNPYRYCWHQPLLPDIVDRLLESNVLASRILSKPSN